MRFANYLISLFTVGQNSNGIADVKNNKKKVIEKHLNKAQRGRLEDLQHLKHF